MHNSNAPALDVAVASTQPGSPSGRKLVEKFGASFPNCVVTEQAACMDGHCGAKRQNSGEDTDSNKENNGRRFILPCAKKVAISLPFFAHEGMYYMRKSHLKLFYADEVLVPLWWIAFVVVVAVSVDALTDPIIASMSDQLRTPWGRRRPLLALGSIVTGVLFLLLWMPCIFGLCPVEEDFENRQCSDGDFGNVAGSWVYLMIVYLLFFISLDFVVVSLMAFSAELTPSYSDRNCLFGVARSFGIVGVAVGVVVPPLVATDYPQIQFAYSGAFFALLLIVSCWTAAGCLRERGMTLSQNNNSERNTDTTNGHDTGSGDVEMVEVQHCEGSEEEIKPDKTVENVASETSDGKKTNGENSDNQASTDDVTIDISSVQVADLDLSAIKFDELGKNTGMVPGFIASMRNGLFRVLVVSEIVESLGDELQYTVLPFVVKYVVLPQTISDSMMFSILAGVVLVMEGAAIPFWMYLSQKFGKWKIYVAWNLTMTCGVCLKLIAGPEAEVGLAPTVVAAFVWGLSLGGAHHLLNSLMADAIDYDEFLSGQRREGSYAVFLDFIPKLVEVPSTVVPLLIMAHFGYQPNVTPQNNEVYWTLLICFSAAPAFFNLLGALILFSYPKNARRGLDTLQAVQDGIVLHAAGKEAYDPVMNKMLAAPQTIRNAIGGADRAIDMQYFFMYEVRAVVNTKQKSRLTCHTAIQVVIYALLSGAMIGLCAFDWHMNIDPVLAVNEEQCSNITILTNCGGTNLSSDPCDECLPGFWGPDCSPCPGLVAQENPVTGNFVGSACNNQGTCDPINGTCTCFERSGYSGPWCGVNLENEPFAWFPVYIALLGVFVFFLAFHAIRLHRAIRVTNDEGLTLENIKAYSNVAYGRELTEEERAIYTR